MSEEEAALNAQLAELAKGEDGAGFLERLAGALFPDGLPGREKLTWPERKKNGRGEGPALTAEERLKAAETRFRTLVEQIPAVTFLAVLGDGLGEIYVSPHIEQLLGFSQQEWLEAPFLWYWQLHPDDRQLWNEEFTRGCQTGGPFKAECRFIARDGHIVWVRGEARLVKDELGRPGLLQGVAFDITDSKKAQEVLLKDATRQARAAQELAIARRVQTSILPRDPQVPGLEISAAMHPAEDVGGDYYDVQPFEGGAWLAIGDVSGHGLDAGLVMMMTQSALAAIVRSRPDITPREVLLQLNALIYENVRTRLHHDDHITFTLLRYKEDGSVVFAGAHEEIVLCRASGQIELLRTPGTWVGGMKEIARSTVESRVQLSPGDVMVLYTDGVTEAQNAHGEMFDIARLTAAVQAGRELKVAELRDKVVSSVRGWMKRQDDDITVFVIRYVGAKKASVVAGPEGNRRVRPPPGVAAPAPTAMHERSLLDSDARAAAVADLHLEAIGVGRLAISSRHDGRILSMRLSGTAESNDVEALEAVLNTLHAFARIKSCKIVELDLRPLKFMSSSCYKHLVTWLSRAAALPKGTGYRVRFVGDAAVRWQRSGVTALVAFTPDLLSEE
jgi:PAS domain S-box-containing protein